MGKKISFKEIWNEAGIGGLALACVSIFYMLLDNRLPKDAVGWTTIIRLTADIAKIVLCIWLMRRFMRDFARRHSTASCRDVRRLGTMMALLSALVFATAQMAWYMWNPQQVEDAFNAVEASMGRSLPRNVSDMLDAMKRNFNSILFISNAVYCFLYGWVLSCILAPRIRPDDPFRQQQ